MLIKAADDRSNDINTLQSLRDDPRLKPDARTRIEQEIRNIRAGAKGESEAAYEMEFYLKASRKWAVIHDLRLEFNGRAAQIDHLLINRVFDFWVCESKHFSEGVSINEHGEFTAFYGKRPYGVPSPIEQNNRHADVLAALLNSARIQLPTRFGVAIKPTIEKVVLVSKNARISRPKASLKGLDRLIKADQLCALIDREADEVGATSALLGLTKIISSETLEQFARQVAALHRPIRVDWAGKFGRPDPPTPLADAIQDSSRIVSEPQFNPFKPVAVPASTAAAEVPTDELHAGRVSTSKLGARLGIKTAGETLARLVAAGLLVVDGSSHRLTPTGIAAGAVCVEKSRYGPYFLWPVELII